MTVSAWPSSLPQFSLEAGIGEQGVSQAIESQLPGASNTRRRHGNASRPLDFSMRFTADQVRTLERFIRDTIKGGALTFTVTHPITFETVTVQLRQPPMVSVVSFDIWDVSFRAIRVG